MSFIVRRGCDSLRRKLADEGLPPLVARVLSARDVSSRRDALPPLADLPPPRCLSQMDLLCDILAAAIHKNEKICVVGDYDADGMCAATLATDGLRQMGANVEYRIPGRMRHGYGLHSEIVEEAAANGAKVLLTADNGASAFDAIARAKELGLKVCVTDHHLPPPHPPDADCLVNPRADADDNPAANITGTGVIFYAIAALRKRLNKSLEMNRFLDLAAIGTIADCATMDKTNRALVGGGLMQIRRGLARDGIAALVDASRAQIESFSVRDISHSVAPKINAAGRLDSSETAMQCLLAKNYSDAAQVAARLAEMNDTRKNIVKKMMAEIVAPAKNTMSVVAHNADWNPGMTGIVAGRLADLWARPAAAFAGANGVWRGSGRAPAGWNLYQLFAESADAGGAINFGGHRRAAGITVRNVESFARAFEESCRRAAEAMPKAATETDAIPPAAEITPDAAEFLDGIAWGESFPRPLFAGTFAASERRAIKGEHLTMRLRGEGLDLAAVVFFRTMIGDSPTVLFSLRKDSFTGQTGAIIESVLAE